MRRQLLFIQGGGAGAHACDRLLVDSLARALGPDREIRYPLMPNEDEPDVDAWKAEIARELAALEDCAILLGHSLGGMILVDALAGLPPPRPLGALFLLAAPFAGEGGWQLDDFETPADLGANLPPGLPVHIFHGEEDEVAPPAHAGLYARLLPQARLHLLPGRDHQLGNDLGEVAEVVRGIWG
ncbi:alpha/beta hydrolase [Sphingosinicella sp. CPCC 101087]|uniref:alpha/beta hydrolase n=1 Tax=Sphingosinicella sp. CPCC 101087 TaxID=2497754 RepID=UPI00101CF874|nr:alpha/beta hydrolase [Sphingosinicella sp. CPCC 101087]